MTSPGVTLVEVGPRDGFQGIGPLIPTQNKITFLQRLSAAGLREIEIGSYVSAKALPQMADTPELLAACTAMPDVSPRVLVPSLKHALRALEDGVTFPTFVLSVSESHNRNNVKRHPDESVGEYLQIVETLPDNADLRLDLSTCFDCPFEGRVDEDAVLRLLEKLVPAKPGAEICLCDTTGKAEPQQVERLFSMARTTFPEVDRWAVHAHDTYGLGLANVYAAYRSGVRIVDASFAGLGGCPFAPGATGNVATEDVVWMFNRMGISTGVDLDGLIPVACDGAGIPGGQSGGRVRAAMAGRTATL
ncbi:hydroxymethylglutaryl-CoA lyase [Seohaeicola zhoushanensis]|uniref:Hydroxymethylglutaryl-CoA lyase n=1 Tax=Seohaeicola zhoushanensis TaxID=1569283 RepID=A0A8J3M8W6_9RHOB|nr:hydroxymethylglutaryl-CoA lyase [Seohaeicola zhoushanensis]GHF62192.1 hydroxymethylglutaryl-CoA lyase [Seohaeicola zhoushanensis]